MNRLKDKDLKAILAGTKEPDSRKLTDGDGLYILVERKKKGMGLYWRYDYTHGKRKTMAYGSFPKVTITEARKRHREAQVHLSNGLDPMALKHAGKVAQSESDSFKTVAFAWLEQKEGLPRHKASVKNYLNNDIFPIIRDKGINEVVTADISAVVQRVANRGSNEQARRVGRWLYDLFRYARTMGLTDSNPADIDLKVILKKTIPKNHAAILEPELLGRFLRDIDCYAGHYSTVCLMKLAALVMLRPGELVGAEWREISFSSATWTIEAKRMKNPQHIKEANRPEDAHIIPLSRQAVDILHEMEGFSAGGKYVFPGLRGKAGHMCPDTIRYAIRNMGYKSDTMTGHGFRATARTMIEERLNFNPELIEKQLAHKGSDKHKGAYDRTKHLEQRREMLQAWADYVDKLRNEAD